MEITKLIQYILKGYQSCILLIWLKKTCSPSTLHTRGQIAPHWTVKVLWEIQESVTLFLPSSNFQFSQGRSGLQPCEESQVQSEAGRRTKGTDLFWIPNFCRDPYSERKTSPTSLGHVFKCCFERHYMILQPDQICAVNAFPFAAWHFRAGRE